MSKKYETIRVFGFDPNNDNNIRVRSYMTEEKQDYLNTNINKVVNIYNQNGYRTIAVKNFGYKTEEFLMEKEITL